MDEGFHTDRGYDLLARQGAGLTSSMEDYLEMIARHSTETGYLRVNQLAGFLSVKASSATRMAQKLRDLRLIQFERYGLIRLTPAGAELGAALLARHQAIARFLTLLGVQDDVLTQTELIEHSLQPDTVARLDALCAFFAANADVARRWGAWGTRPVP